MSKDTIVIETTTANVGNEIAEQFRADNVSGTFTVENFDPLDVEQKVTLTYEGDDRT